MVSKNIDILFLNDNGLDTIGGEQESTKIIINALKEHYKLGVIQPGKIKEEKKEVSYFKMTDHTRIKHLIKHPILFLKYIRDIKKIINKKKPKIIHTQAQVSFFTISLLKKLRLIPKDIFFFHTERGLYTKYSSFFKKIFFFCMSELDTLITTTHFNMGYWKTALEKRNFNLDYRIIENTAGDLFEDYNPDKELKDSHDFVVGFAGRYTEWKNWPMAVKIAEELNERLGSKLTIKMAIGCLDDKAIKETKEMFNYLQSIFGNRFEGEINIGLKDMDSFYYDLDMFILTSNYNTESFGRTLVEAMSRKTAVLTTNAGGSVEVVGNNNNVCKTVDQFVERTILFYSYPDILEQEKCENLNRVKRKYSYYNNINKHSELYSNFLYPKALNIERVSS